MIRKIITAIALPAIALCSCNNENSTGSNNTTSATEVVSPGKALFISNCAICHDLKKDKTGPKLEGVLTRWNNDTTKLKAFIRNSQEVIKSGDPYATRLYQQWASTVMTPFPSLTDQELNDIVTYLDKGDQ